MKNIKEKDWWIILVVVGVVVLNYPFMSIFNGLIYIAGLPLFFIYLYLGWIISIFIIYLYVRFLNNS
ncbi:MAG: hypothetical protein N2999_07400 [Proteobacteria bacterium]|nr:hypothetical protein [Pseudomonadota bacterium]